MPKSANEVASVKRYLSQVYIRCSERRFVFDRFWLKFVFTCLDLVFRLSKMHFFILSVLKKQQLQQQQQHGGFPPQQQGAPMPWQQQGPPGMGQGPPGMGQGPPGMGQPPQGFGHPPQGPGMGGPPQGPDTSQLQMELQQKLQEQDRMEKNLDAVHE